ncbi:Ig-like domain-containing protein [Planktotalea sp.]|uniref:Ig-like domain-containing protein n=1 Tax=Planktotalea sp. TaxID=2029877 RepID=UPI003D6B019E
MPNHLNLYSYGHSLVNYEGGDPAPHTDYTNILYWMNLFAQELGDSFSFAGEFGQFNEFVAKGIASPGLSIDGVPASDLNGETFGEADYNTVMLTPANWGHDGHEFYSAAHFQNQLTDAQTLIDRSIAAQLPGDTTLPNFVIYQSWPEMAEEHGLNWTFPQTDAQFDEYVTLLTDTGPGSYHQWYVDFADQLQASPPVQMLPIAYILGQLLQDTTLNLMDTMDPEDLFGDNAPHGTETLYFLAGMIAHIGLNGTQSPPPEVNVGAVHPTVLQNYSAIAAIVDTELTNAGFSPTAETTSNLTPTAFEDDVTMDAGTDLTVDVLTGSVDPEGNPLQIWHEYLPGGVPKPIATESGSYVVNENGTITYTPQAGFNGTDEIVYYIHDGQGGSDQGVITVQVGTPPTNTAPAALDDVSSIDIATNSSVDIDVLFNDGVGNGSGVDGDGDTLAITEVGPAANGTVEIVNDQIRYTPDGTLGADSFTYTISDGTNTTTATVNMTITDSSTPSAPATFQASYWEVDGSVVDLASVVFANLEGPDATGTLDTLDFSSAATAGWTGGPADNYIASFTGTLLIESGGDYQFRAPWVDDQVRVIIDGQLVFQAGFTEGDYAGNNAGDLITLAAGTHNIEIQYLENLGDDRLELQWSGPDTAGIFTTLSDTSLTNGGTPPTNAAPAALDDVSSIDIATNSSVDIDVLFNDGVGNGSGVDVDGDTLTITEVGPAANGTVEIVNDQIRYTPDGTLGADSFTYTISDGTNTTTTTVNMTITDSSTPSAPATFQASYWEVDGSVDDLASVVFANLEGPDATGTLDTLDFSSAATAGWTGGPADNYIASFTGTLLIESGGDYQFRAPWVDDQVRVIIDGQLVFQAGFTEGDYAGNNAGDLITLAAGTHNIEIQYLENLGDDRLELQWSGPDTAGIFTTLSDTSLTNGGAAQSTLALGELDPSLAIGLAGIANTSTQHPFINVALSASQWFGQDPFTSELIDVPFESLTVDANGVPTEIPAGAGWVSSVLFDGQGAYTNPLEGGADAALGEVASVAGTYHLTYDGSGTIEIVSNSATISNVNDDTPGEITFDYTPTDEAVFIYILDTQSGDNIRNIQVVHEDNLEAHAAGATFNPNWINLIDDARVIRFMDWMDTNVDVNEPDIGSSTAWEDRPSVGDYSYSTGVPVEVIVALGNQVGADIWVNIPHDATDDYIQQFAQYVMDNLDPELNVYVEYSNETWNGATFGHPAWLWQEALDRWGATDQTLGDFQASQPTAAMQYAGLRASEMSTIWNSVFTGSDAERLKVVAAPQPELDSASEIPSLISDYMTVPLEAGLNPINDGAFDVFAGNGYFGADFIEDQAQTVLNMLNEGDSFEDVGIWVTNQLQNSYLPNLIDAGGSIDMQSQVATSYGLALIMYEGGTHLAPGPHSFTDGGYDSAGTELLGDFFAWYNYSDDVVTMYQDLLNAWIQFGGESFNAFVDVASPTENGSWGGLHHLDDSNPRWDVLMDYNSSDQPGWGDGRSEGAFDHGSYAIGTEESDTIIGTSEEDLILAGDGDDFIFSFGGSDTIHGGDGTDEVSLLGSETDYTFADVDGVTVASTATISVNLASVEYVSFEDDGASSHLLSDFLLL